MVSTYDTKVPDRRTSIPKIRPSETEEISSGDSSLDRRARTKVMDSSETRSTQTGTSMASSPPIKSRLPWLDGKPPSKQGSVRTTRTLQMPPDVVASSGLRAPSPSAVSSPPNMPPCFQSRSIMSETNKLLVDGNTSSPSSSDATSRALPSTLRNHFSQFNMEGKPSSKPVRGLRPPGPRVQPVGSSKTPKIELVAVKEPLPTDRERFPIMQEPVKELRSAPNNTPLTMPISHTWSSPEAWPTESSTSELVSPKYVPRGHRRSFHEPELNAAINRMEDLMQEAGALAEEAVKNGRPQEFSQILDEAEAFHLASHISQDHRPFKRHEPLRFRVTNTSSESSISTSSSSASGTVVTKTIHTSRPAVHPKYSRHGRHPKSENDFIADQDSDPTTPSRGRTKQRQAQYNEALGISSGTNDFAYTQRSRSGSRSSSTSLKHWIGRRPTRKSTNLPNAPIDTHVQHRGDTVKMSRPIRLDPPVSALRHRKSTIQQKSPPSHPWVPPHYNTSYKPVDGNTSRLRTKGHVHLDEDPSRKSKHRDHHGFGLESRAYRQGVDAEKAAIRVRRGSQIDRVHTKRDPIARRWGRFRKRFTATVACINTAIIGYIIGVYVCQGTIVILINILTGHRQAWFREFNSSSLINSTTIFMVILCKLSILNCQN
jgi:hypothetical protein